MAAVGMFSSRRDEDHIEELTFATTVAEDRAASGASWNKCDVILSMIVLAITASMFIYFSPLGVTK